VLDWGVVYVHWLISFNRFILVFYSIHWLLHWVFCEYVLRIHCSLSLSSWYFDRRFVDVLNEGFYLGVETNSCLWLQVHLFSYIPKLYYSIAFIWLIKNVVCVHFVILFVFLVIAHACAASKFLILHCCHSSENSHVVWFYRLSKYESWGSISCI